jgi:putative membrane protein
VADLILAILHHLLVFALAGILGAEMVLMKPGLGGRNLAVLARIDAVYGGLAAAIIVIGICRVFYGLKGWEFYVYNSTFWAKMIAFAAVGLLSISPTMRILRWRKAAADAAYMVPDKEIAGARAFLRAEMLALTLILVFAAAMARGY